jgi:hypothetical protein
MMFEIRIVVNIKGVEKGHKGTSGAPVRFYLLTYLRVKKCPVHETSLG